MNYIFFGTPRFAEIVLRELIAANVLPMAIVCNPDRPIGRKKIVTAPPVKQLVLDSKLPIVIFQPELLDATFEQKLRDLKPDFFVVAAYAKIIPQQILDVARLGTLGTHPSLLPKYRGASPIQSTILAGEKMTGVTIYHMDAKMDHGPILASDSVPMRNDEDYLELEAELARHGGKLLARTMPDFVTGTTQPVEQNHDMATFTKKFRTEDGFIAEDELLAAERGEGDPASLYRKILALNPEPGVWTLRKDKRLKLLEAKLMDGTLRLTLTQYEGEKPKKVG